MNLQRAVKLRSLCSKFAYSKFCCYGVSQERCFWTIFLSAPNARVCLLFCLLSRNILWIFFPYLPGNFALKKGGNFWWIFSGLRFLGNEARKFLLKIWGKFGAKFGRKFGTKIRKIRGTFVLPLFGPNCLDFLKLSGGMCLPLAGWEQHGNECQARPTWSLDSWGEAKGGCWVGWEEAMALSWGPFCMLPTCWVLKSRFRKRGLAKGVSPFFETEKPCPSFPCFFWKRQGKPPKNKDFLFPPNPWNPWKRSEKRSKKQGIPRRGKNKEFKKKQGKEGQGMDEMEQTEEKRRTEKSGQKKPKEKNGKIQRKEKRKEKTERNNRKKKQKENEKKRKKSEATPAATPVAKSRSISSWTESHVDGPTTEHQLFC